jgi:hypothetical protein
MTEPTVSVSIAFKKNLGNYQSADYFVSLSGLKAGTTVEQMQPLLETGRLAWEVIRAALAEQIKRGPSE